MTPDEYRTLLTLYKWDQNISIDFFGNSILYFRCFLCEVLHVCGFSFHRKVSGRSNAELYYYRHTCLGWYLSASSILSKYFLEKNMSLNMRQFVRYFQFRRLRAPARCIQFPAGAQNMSKHLPAGKKTLTGSWRGGSYDSFPHWSSMILCLLRVIFNNMRVSACLEGLELWRRAI